MSRFGMTGMVLVKVDREVDAYTHIDHVREEVFDQRQELDELQKRVKILEDAERERLTKTGAWTFVRAKLDAEAVSWRKWAVSAGLLGMGAGMIKAAEWLIRKAMQ